MISRFDVMRFAMRVGRLSMVAAGFAVVVTSTSTGSRAQESRCDHWFDRAPLAQPRNALASAVAGGEAYAIGGYTGAHGQFSEVEAYDPSTNSWTQKASMSVARNRLAAATATNRVYAVGGINTVYQNILEEYDPTLDSWVTKTPMPTNRSDLVAVAVDDKVYAIGGANLTGVVATVEVYDPATNTWATKAPMPIPTQYAAAAAVGGKIYVFGGNPGFYPPLDTVEEYDPAADSWRVRAPMPTARDNSPGAVALNDLIFVMGGSNPALGGAVNAVEVYDPATDTWRTLSPMSTARRQPGVAAIDGRIYVFGGYNEVSGALSSNEVDEFLLDGTPCNDGNECTYQDMCFRGVCVGALWLPEYLCNDQNPCTVDTCDPAVGCVHTLSPNGTACSSNYPCSAGGCVDGHCVPAPNICADGNPCTEDYCGDVGCRNQYTPGVPCDDGNACTVDDRCPLIWPPHNGGPGCASGPPRDCDDGNQCTDDSCDPATGCIHTPVALGMPCNDGSLCTIDDTCGPNGICGGAWRFCNDLSRCTDDSCDPVVGCVFTAISCDDHNACTADYCSSYSGCQHYNLCEDFNLCTIDVCDPETGCSHHPFITCDDSNGCTDDSCNPANGMCVFASRSGPCNDNNLCTSGETCQNGSCTPALTVVCDDHNDCTDDVCNPATGSCVLTNREGPCDDGSLCTTGDVCTAGVCSGTSHLNEPHPRTIGYYKGLCEHSHSGDTLTSADAACVAASTATFDMQTVADLCAIITRHDGGDDDGDDHQGYGTGTHNTYCDKARAELVAFALNRCRARVCDAQQIDSDCDPSVLTVGQSFATVDGFISGSNPSNSACKNGRCLAREINNGRAFEIDDVHCDRDDHHHRGGMHCHWSVPRYNDDTSAPRHYDIWRREQGTTAFTKVATVNVPEYYVEDPDDSYDYDVTPVQ